MSSCIIKLVNLGNFVRKESCTQNLKLLFLLIIELMTPSSEAWKCFFCVNSYASVVYLHGEHDILDGNVAHIFPPLPQLSCRQAARSSLTNYQPVCAQFGDECITKQLGSVFHQSKALGMSLYWYYRLCIVHLTYLVKCFISFVRLVYEQFHFFGYETVQGCLSHINTAITMQL